MTRFERGEVVLVQFVFADERGRKRRPGLILSSADYHADRNEVVIAALTSNTERLLYGDTLLTRWSEAGLPRPSVVTAIVRTVKESMIAAGVGRLPQAEMKRVESNLRRCLGL